VLGVDPLDPAFTIEYLAGALAASKRDIKAFLMDQSRVAGLGNIYVCEALFRAGIAPKKRSDRLVKKAPALHAAIVASLADGIANRGTSFSDYVDADGQSGGNQHSARTGWTFHVFLPALSKVAPKVRSKPGVGA
jgi:formamidopyrimidine-DNA glycosylase